MTVLAALVDVEALWRTIWTAAVAGLLVTVCCSFAVLGAARRAPTAEPATTGARRLGWTVVAVLGLVATAGVILYGLSEVVA